MGKFGELFERYVERSIAYAGVKYYTESDIKVTHGETGNQIDFIIQEDDSNIFIDAKAVEMNYQGKVTYSSTILRDKTKKTILKAIKQAHDVIRKLAGDKSEIESRKNNYLLVVTFKDLYLGNGTTYYEIVAKAKMDEIYTTYEGYPTIPPENMYFITVDDLDIICEILKEGTFKLSELIESFKVNDKKPETRKFDVRLHLHNLETRLKYPDFISTKNDEILDRLVNAVS